MSESKQDMVERVRLMATDASNETWDFSDNDTTALAYVLKSREDALDSCRGLVTLLDACRDAVLQRIGTTWDTEQPAIVAARAVLAEAEGN